MRGWCILPCPVAHGRIEIRFGMPDVDSYNRLNPVFTCIFYELCVSIKDFAKHVALTS
jgi:hypothetical protein